MRRGSGNTFGRVIAVVFCVVAVSGVCPRQAAQARDPSRPKKPEPVVLLPGKAVGPCTTGFAYAGSDGKRYIATAGHCLLDVEVEGDGERRRFGNGMEMAWPEGDGPPLVDYRGPPWLPESLDPLARPAVGRYVYSIWNQSSLFRAPEGFDPTLPDPADFALVRPGHRVRVEPRVCHFGGPTGTNTSADPDLQVARYVGGGQFVGMERTLRQPLVSARTGVIMGLDAERELRLRGPGFLGDSGMPVLDDHGQALGILGNPGDGVGGDDIVPVMRLQPHVERAEEVLGIELELLRADLHPAATPVASATC